MSTPLPDASAPGGGRLLLRPLLVLVWHAAPRLLVGLVLLTLLEGAIPPLLALFTARLIDTLLRLLEAPSAPGALPWEPLLQPLLLLGAVGMASQLVRRLSEVLTPLFQTRVTNHVQLRLAEQAAVLDLSRFEDPEFHNRFSNASLEANFRPVAIIHQLRMGLSLLVTLGGATAVVLSWHLWVAPLVLVASLATFWVSTYFGRQRVELVLRRTETSRRASYLRTVLTSDLHAKEVRLFNLSGFLLGRLRGLMDAMYQQDRALAGRQLRAFILAEVLLATVQPLLVAYAAFQVLSRQLTLGQLTLYSQGILQMHQALNQLMGLLAQLHESNLFIANLFHFLELKPEVERPANALPRGRLKEARPRLELREVSFRYPGTERDVLHRVSMRLEPGEAVALVGQNGAGKSTLVKLLAGLYRPTSGTILLEGVDINELDREELRARLSIVFQDYAIYHLSAGENIGLGNVEHVQERPRIEAAARKSGLDRIIAQLPHGYDTMLGRFFERGHELSGGQRQLVGLTRALMRQAPILVLDEPSAALDVHAEQHFFQKLLDEPTGLSPSVLFISHRFTTVRRAHRILVLENGAVVEQGSHDELMARAGRYAEMFTAQLQAYEAPVLAPPIQP